MARLAIGPRKGLATAAAAAVQASVASSSKTAATSTAEAAVNMLKIIHFQHTSC